MNDESIEGEVITLEEWEAMQAVNKPIAEVTILEILTDTSW